MNNNSKDYNKILRELFEITEKLNHLKDIDSLLDNILYEARKFTNADSGSIFLKEGDSLEFRYVQNDTIAKIDETNNKYIYSNVILPINTDSIAGYVAYTGKPVIINDVYSLSDNVPYCFNKHYDEISNYHTQSMLTIPLVTSRDQVIGVMQIINAQDDNKNIIPFTEEDNMYVSFFANNASVAIEKAKMTREIILRMIRMAELRDPKETGAHVNRVGAYSIEIYSKWAKIKGKSEREIKHFNDMYRIAAMLHDVGKVAISDIILKKPARLNEEEYKIMQTHTVKGADLFHDSVSDFDMLSAEVSVTHHEKWDGTGYPKKLKGDEIPITGRIVALADVYDALMSKRVYKDAWDEKKVLDFIKSESGKHFDPDVVQAFLSIYDIIIAIRNKYPESN